MRKPGVALYQRVMTLVAARKPVRALLEATPPTEQTPGDSSPVTPMAAGPSAGASPAALVVQEIVCDHRHPIATRLSDPSRHGAVLFQSAASILRPASVTPTYRFDSASGALVLSTPAGI